MRSNLLVCWTVALTLATPLFAQNAVTESGRGGRLRLDGGSSSSGGNPLFDDRTLSDLPVEKTPKPQKKSKGPTEIVALGATFDQKAHQAVFIGQVVVTDPEFNVQCDKLTAFLKHDDQPAPDTTGRLKPVTPDVPEPKPDKKSKGGGLERAIAEAELGNVVTIRQEKLEADGSTSNSVGRGRKAVYDAVSGDITLTGRPEVQQGFNTCISTDEGTVMILNRDGRMRVDGPHKTIIKDQGDAKK